MKCRLFFAGSGGQGTLAIGQIIAKAAMEEGREVTWLPSYGPEMRGGTANCTVVVSDQPIRCPLIDEADVLVVMNLPSLLKFEPMLVPNGLLFVNSDLVPQEPKRSDLRVHKIPINTEAQRSGFGSKRSFRSADPGPSCSSPDTSPSVRRRAFPARGRWYPS